MYWLLLLAVTLQGQFFSVAQSQAVVVNDKVCFKKGYTSNDLKNLPRMNPRSFTMVEKNWAYYDMYTCEKDSQGELILDADGVPTCEFLDVSNAANGILNPGSNEDNTSDYFAGLGFYWVVAIVMCICSLLAGICLCVGRYCCRCYTCCGGRYPTRLKEGSFIPLGFVEMRKADGTVNFGYPDKARWASRGFMWFFALMVFIWIGRGHYDGSKGAPVAMKALAAAPENAVDTMLGTVDLFANLAEDLVGVNLVNILGGFQSVILDNMDLGLILDSTDCVIDELTDIPDLATIGTILTDEINAFSNISDLLGDLDVALADLENQTDALDVFIVDLEDIVTGVEEDLGNIVSAINVTKQKVEPLAEFQTILLNNLTGVRSMIIDLEALSNAPNQTTIWETVGWDGGLFNNTMSGSLESHVRFETSNQPLAPVEYDELTNRLAALSTSFGNLPNYSKTADNMEAYNQQIRDFVSGPILQDIQDSLRVTDAYLKNLTASQVDVQINNTINDLVFAIRNFSFSGIRNFVNLAEQKISGANISGLTDAIDSIIDAEKLQGCFLDMFNEIINVNATLFEFPESINGAVDQIKEVNKTFDEVIAQKNNMTASFDTFLADSVDFTQFYSDVDIAEADVQGAADDVDTVDLVDSVSKVLNASDLGDDLDVLISNITSMNETLQNPNITIAQEVIDGIRNLSSLVESTKASLPLAIQDYFDLGSGLCTGTSTLCSVDGDCGGTCDEALKRRSRCKDENFAACTKYSPGGTCTSSCATDHTTLQVQLLATETALSSLDVTDAVQALRDMDAALVENLEDYQRDLDNAFDQANNVSTADVNASLADMRSGLGQLNTTQYGQQFRDQLDSVSELTNATSLVEDLLDNLNGSLAEVDAIKEQLNETQVFTNMIHKMFLPGKCDDCPKINTWLDMISKEELITLREQIGIDAEVIRLGEVLDMIIEFVQTEQSLFVVEDFNFTGQMAKPAQFLRVLSYDEYTEHGPYHFAASLALAIGSDESDFQPLPPDDPNLARVNVGKDGQPYPNEQTCLTLKCINAEIDYWADESVDNLLLEINIENPTGVPLMMSPVSAVSSPFLLPGFIAMIGLVASLLICKGSAQDFCSSFLSSCSVCLMFCSAPIIFLLAGSFFLVPLFVGDTCLGAENVGYQMFQGQGDLFCETLGGTGTLENCTMALLEASATTPELTFDLNLLKTYTAILGGCRAEDDPTLPIFTSTSESFGIFIPALVEEEVNKTEGLRAPIRAVVTNNSLGIVDSFQTFMGDLPTVIGCGALHNVYQGVKGGFCCESLTAIYWMIASWYLIGWTFICCGCCAGLLGRKRFPDQLWGPHYEKALTELGDYGDGDEENYDFEEYFDKDEEGEGGSQLDLDDNGEGDFDGLDLPMAEPMSSPMVDGVGMMSPAPEDRTVSDGMSGQLMASPIPDVPAVPGSETNANDDEIEI